MHHLRHLLLPLGLLGGCASTPDETDLLAPEALVLAAYDDTLYAVDVDDPQEPALVARVALGGRANETFYITDKAVGSFKINSSNGSSTAYVDWIVTR